MLDDALRQGIAVQRVGAQNDAETQKSLKFECAS